MTLCPVHGVQLEYKVLPSPRYWCDECNDYWTEKALTEIKKSKSLGWHIGGQITDSILYGDPPKEGN